MKKILGAAALSLSLLFGVSSVSEAGFGFIVNGATVDDITTTVCTTALGEAITGFGNGVSMDQVWQLEKEVGSKGSGAWKVVLKDVFPNANGSAAVGGVTQVMHWQADQPSCYRLRMLDDNGGTAQIQLVSGRDGVTAFPGRATHWENFDDFHGGLIPITTGHSSSPTYIIHDGGGSGVVLTLTEGEPEGTITFSSGSVGDDTDASTGSVGLITNGILVSDGTAMAEVRIAMSQITDVSFGFGLVDVVSTGTEIEPFQCNTNVCIEGPVATVQNAVVIHFDTNSNDAEGDFWLAGTNNANTFGNASDEYSLGSSPVAATYTVLRVEIDGAGNAYFYINGVLQGAEPLAVATTAILVPYWWAWSPDVSSGTVNKVHFDYLHWWAARPSTVS